MYMYMIKECYTSLVEYSIKQYPRGSPLSTPAVCVRYLKETSCPYGEENFRTSCLHNEVIIYNYYNGQTYIRYKISAHSVSLLSTLPTQSL